MKQAGLKLNTQKTKGMKMIGNKETIGMKDLTINGKNIEAIDKFIYQGGIFTNDCDDSK